MPNPEHGRPIMDLSRHRGVRVLSLEVFREETGTRLIGYLPLCLANAPSNKATTKSTSTSRTKETPRITSRFTTGDSTFRRIPFPSPKAVCVSSNMTKMSWVNAKRAC